MEIIVKVVMVLTLATTAIAVGIDPNQLKCTAESPLNPQQFSNTNPPVGLTHIFCGDIRKEGTTVKAQGFHSRVRVNKVGNACARATGDLLCADKWSAIKDCTCCFYSKGIEVFDHKTGEYVEKKTNKNRPNKFFPETMDPKGVVDIALKVFKEEMGGKMKKGDNDACLPKVMLPDCTTPTAVTIFTDGKNIISAFPVDKC